MEHYFAVRYGDIVVVLYHEDMRDVRELLFENSRKEKTLKKISGILLYDRCEGGTRRLEWRKTRGLKAAVKYVKEHDIGMTEEQIQGLCKCKFPAQDAVRATLGWKFRTNVVNFIISKELF